jgi:hypothetical protein
MIDFTTKSSARVVQALDQAGATYMPNQIRDLPAFDMFVGQAAPYLGFGEIAQDSPQFERELRAEAAEIRQEVRSTFGVKLEKFQRIRRNC